jgi:YD repeat-containing protein
VDCKTNTYDALGQLTRIVKSGAGDVFKASYHPDGSLSSYRAAEGSIYSYVYPKAGTEEANKGLRKPASRIAGAVTETYLYDTAGRRTSSTKNGVTTSYLYDGLGRVRRVSIDGVPKMDYYYDAKGKVISELANPTTGGTPVYFLGSWRYFSQNDVEVEDYSKFMSATLIPNTLPAPAPEKVWGWI